MTLMHFTKPSGRVAGTSLDLLELQIRRLRLLCERWRATDPDGLSGRAVVRATWEHGSIGKLIIEHSALLIGAEQDALRVLENTDFPLPLDGLRHHLDEAVTSQDEVWEVARGVHPVDLMTNHRFSGVLDDLLGALSEDLTGRWAGSDTDSATAHLRQHRDQLRSARYIRSHSPSHPSGRYAHRRIAPLLRSKVAFDRLRGYPWAESSSFGDTGVAKQIDEMT